jgi:hypothetical protein
MLARLVVTLTCLKHLLVVTAITKKLIMMNTFTHHDVGELLVLGRCLLIHMADTHHLYDSLSLAAMLRSVLKRGLAIRVNWFWCAHGAAITKLMTMFVIWKRRLDCYDWSERSDKEDMKLRGIARPMSLTVRGMRRRFMRFGEQSAEVCLMSTQDDIILLVVTVADTILEPSSGVMRAMLATLT